MGGWAMKENKKTTKTTKKWHEFLINFKENRIKLGSNNKKVEFMCDLPDIVVDYFKKNNDEYLELCKTEVDNGTK